MNPPTSNRSWALAGIAVFLLLPFLAGAATLTVLNTNGDNSDDSLRKAIGDAMPGDTIVFDIGLDASTIRLDGTELLVDKDLTIDASGLSDGITIDGDKGDDGPSADDSRVMTVDAGAVVLIKSVTFTGGMTKDALAGRSESAGGGIRNIGTLTLEDCTISDNRTGESAEGGGISNEDSGFLVMKRCTVSGNRTGDGIEDIGTGFAGDGGYGGGIANGFDATLEMERCTISGNSTGDGVSNPSNTRGSAGGYGGGIVNSGTGPATLRQCTVSGNFTGNGGAGSTSSGNGGYGGAFANEASAQTPVFLTLEGCTVVGNGTGNGGGGGGTSNVGGNGGGIALVGGGYMVALTDTIIAGNTIGAGANGPDLEVGFDTTLAGVNLIGDNSSRSGGVATTFPAPATPGTPNVNGDFVGTGASPLFHGLGALADNGGPTLTQLPLNGSPALDPTGGATSSGFATDQRGFTRILGSAMDIGAVEAPGFVPPVVRATVPAADPSDLLRKLKKLKKKAKNAKRKGQKAKAKKYKKQIKKVTAQIRAL